jgi:hypothetical protein
MKNYKKPSKKKPMKKPNNPKVPTKKDMRGCIEPYSVGDDRPYYG